MSAKYGLPEFVKIVDHKTYVGIICKDGNQKLK